MPGPLPKDDLARRRRNARRGAVLPVDGRSGPPPPLGRPPGGKAWHEATRAWWKAIWASPMATEWLEADAYTLRRLAAMHDAINRGQGTGALARESRLLEDAFGLSPYGRRRLEWTIAERRSELATVAELPHRRMRAVETSQTREAAE